MAESALENARKGVHGALLNTASLLLMVVGGAHQDPTLIQEMDEAFKLHFHADKYFMVGQQVMGEWTWVDMDWSKTRRFSNTPKH